MYILIKKIRRERGISLSELSRLSGVARSTIGYMEINATDPSIGTLCKIAKALGVPTSELYSCDD